MRPVLSDRNLREDIRHILSDSNMREDRPVLSDSNMREDIRPVLIDYKVALRAKTTSLLSSRSPLMNTGTSIGPFNCIHNCVYILIQHIKMTSKI